MDRSDRCWVTFVLYVHCWLLMKENNLNIYNLTVSEKKTFQISKIHLFLVITEVSYPSIYHIHYASIICHCISFAGSQGVQGQYDRGASSSQLIKSQHIDTNHNSLSFTFIGHLESHINQTWKSSDCGRKPTVTQREEAVRRQREPLHQHDAHLYYTF